MHEVIASSSSEDDDDQESQLSQEEDSMPPLIDRAENDDSTSIWNWSVLYSDFDPSEDSDLIPKKTLIKMILNKQVHNSDI